MITVRGDGVVGCNGKAINKEEMQRIARAYILIEKGNI